MTQVTFFILFILLVTLYYFRNSIFGFKDKESSLAKTIINYVFAALLVTLIALGFLLAPNTSSSFGKSNPMFESMSSNSKKSSTTNDTKNSRPHPLFDINTYW
jgi:hypothetical protein